MTKFEEEFKALTSWDWVNVDLIQQILTRFGNWHSDEEFQAKEKEIKRLRKINHLYKKAKGNAERLAVDRGERLNQAQDELASLESQLQQQALPVVPECVGEFVSGDETKLSKADRIAYLLKSVQRDSYYLTEELPGDGTITVDEGQELYNWAICQYHETILKLWNGYTVEKPQLFYLKNKITEKYLRSYTGLSMDDTTLRYEEVKDERVGGFGGGTTFTQQEIDSMQTGSYEQIEVAE